MGSSKSFSLTLVRHGETDLNRLGVLQGQSVDPNLNDEGRAQAKAIGRYLSSEAYTHIFSSDLLRARETCELLLSENDEFKRKSNQATSPMTKIIFDKRLRERSFGVMEGKTSDDLNKAALLSGSTYWEFVPDGAETMKEMEERGNTFFRDLCNDCYRFIEKDKPASDVNVLVVSHGGFLATLISSFSKNYGCSFPPGKLGGISLNTGRSCFNVRFLKRFVVCDDSSSSDSSSHHLDNSGLRKVHMTCTVLNNYDHLSDLRY